MKAKHYLSTRELADYFRVHPENIRRLVRKKVIPYMRVTPRSHLRFDLQKVLAATRYQAMKK